MIIEREYTIKTKILDSSIAIHTTPLEKIEFNDNLTITFDDEKFNRITKKFINVLSYKVTYEDVWDHDFMCEEAFYKDEEGNGRYRRCIYELLDSKWLEELKHNYEEVDAGIFERSVYHHYILHLGDNILEVIAEKMV